MLDESFGDQFPVDVTISSSGKGLATDRGVLWFADGLMGFSGESASFVLAASDLAPRWDAAKRPKNWNQLPPDAISLVGAPREAHIVITPLRGKWRAYRERLAAFMRADEEPRGERQWPPLYPYAEEPPALEPVVRR
ncbi:hypothetical protein EON82_19425 [bacterium]|nr:MAG: hypothetical protein EON82_19425 [bacterium]